MSPTTAGLAAPQFPVRARPTSLILAVLGMATALAIGFAAGNPTLATFGPAVLLACAAIILLASARPFGAYLVLAASSIFLIVILLPGNRGLNLFDLLLPPLLLASLLGTARGEALAVDRQMTDPRHREVQTAARNLARSVVVFYGIAALSIVVMGLSGGAALVANSTFSLVRAVQGLLLFPLGLWWLRSEPRIHMTFRAMFVGGLAIAIANVVAVSGGAVPRAGQTWVLNQPEKPIDDPNAAGITMLLLIVLLLVRQSQAHRIRNVVMIALALGMLVMTQSRSALLASLTFMAVVLPRARWRWILLAILGIGVAVPFIPDDYWTRLAKTLALERGSFEAYTSLIRIYSWKVALAVFRDHPILGVGYLGFSAFSGQYGDLRLALATVDNFYLETAAGMGIVGLLALGLVIVRQFQLGAAVRLHAPRGSLGHAMASYHAPLFLAMLVVNMTGGNFIGMVTLGQLALWSAMMVRAGHLAIDGPARLT